MMEDPWMDALGFLLGVIVPVFGILFILLVIVSGVISLIVH